MKRWPKIIEDRVRGKLIPIYDEEFKKYEGVVIELGKCVLGTKNEDLMDEGHKTRNTKHKL